VVLTSLTKSFNGQANTMGGSIVLNPLSPHYAALSRDFKATFHNELFHVDAAVILENSKDLLQRQPVHDRNARAMAEFLHATIADPESPIVKVLYPSVLPCKKYYDQFRRRSTPELPEPGYGGLLTVDFESVATAAAFYDNNGFYAGPHLGAPFSLQLPYSMTRLSKKPEDKEFFAKMGSMEASIRFAAGLEAEEDIIDTIKVALEAAKEANRNPGKAKEAEAEAEGEAKAA
jgi:cystathionine gamma-synthase